MARPEQVQNPIQDLILRRANTDDAAALNALMVQLSADFIVDPGAAGPFWESISTRSEAAYIADPRYFFLLAVKSVAGQEKLCGFIASRDLSHVFHLFVDPAWQKRGLARLLWQHLQQHARAQGHAGGFTVNASLPAVPVYQSFGFMPSAEQVVVNGLPFQAMRCPP